MNKLLLLDFDGTLCLGDDPVLAYARTVDSALQLKGLHDALPHPVTAIVTEAFAQDTLLVEEIEYDDAGVPLAASYERDGVTPSGTSAAKAHPTSWPLQDGYQLVQLLAVQAGLSNEDAGHAFRAARRELVGRGLQHTDLHAPEGAVELLEELRGRRCAIVLVTNSPEEGFGVWLQALGLQGSFDAVINSAQKPFGMPEAVQRARQAVSASAPEQSILSVGDIWANDLAHVAELGGETILIDRFGTGLGEPAHRVRSFAEADPMIRRWSGWTQFSEPAQAQDVNNR